MGRRGLLATLCALIAIPWLSITLASTAEAQASMSVRIDTAVVEIGEPAEIDILLDESANEIGGFDFLIVYDADILSLVDAQPGADLYDLCEWEYFIFGSGQVPGCEEDCPSGSVRVVGIAETINGEEIHPSCFLPDTFPGSIARLNFIVNANPNHECQWVPLRFYWTNCGFNTVTSRTAHELYQSSSVYDFDGTTPEVLIPGDTAFPSYGGTIPECIDSTAGTPSLAAIDYYNGGVEILCLSAWDDRGDINLDGLSYTISDWVLFDSYFYNGLEVFTIDTSRQIDASDINGDVRPLTLLDYVSLSRVTVGLMLPPEGYEPADPTPTVAFAQDTTGGLLSVECPDSLAAVLLDFDGDITPTYLFDTAGIRCWHRFDGEQTRVMISMIEPDYSTATHEALFPGPLLTYTGTGTLANAEAAGWDNTFYVPGISVSDGHDATMFIKIDTARTELGESTEIDILLDEGAGRIGGFEFLIAYDANVLSLVDAQPGHDLYDSCGWEYFTYSTGPAPGCEESCPSGLVRIIGLADMADGDNHPSCLFPENLPSSVATLSFLVTEDQTYECLWTPLRFYWTDCGDNALSNQTGLVLYQSLDVYEFDRDVYDLKIAGDTAFPSYGGTIPDCLDPEAAIPSVATIDFRNGGVEIRCAGDIDDRGDINLSGIPYEIADWVTFDYFFYVGYEAFIFDSSQQIANTDINGDGKTLTLHDLVNLAKVQLGMAYPIPEGDTIVYPTDTVEFLQDTINGLASVECPDSLVAMLLDFDGEIVPTYYFDQTGLQCWSHFDGDRTRVMINGLMAGYPAADYRAFYSGPLFSYTGEATLINAEAAGFGDTWYEIEYIHWPIIPPSCGQFTGGITGNANCSTDGKLTLSDISAIIDRVYISKTPLCYEANGNTNGDPECLITLSDITRLIDAVYVSGTAPEPCLPGCGQ